MALESGVLAKIAAAVGLAGVSSAGVYYGQDYFSPKNLLSKYDQALIDFLKEEGKDIVFDVKKVTNNDVGNNLQVSDLAFTTTPNANSVKAKVQVTVPATLNTSNDHFKGTNAAASLTTIKTNTNTKTPETWTWSCELEFKREGDNASSLNDIPNKEWIMKDTDLGLFHILKKDTTATSGSQLTADAKQLVKEAKVEFVKRCAKARGAEKNKALDTQAYSTTTDNPNAPSTTHTFTFMAETGASPSALVNKEGSDFNDWFKEDYANTKYTTTQS